ncbi:MAG: hypothetical protein J1F11_01320 [Oscillospiraceae bacterium]|nr:hypothetical protein [Oscillospiraceae bacterium]
MIRKVYYFSTLADKNSPLYATGSKYIFSTGFRGAEPVFCGAFSLKEIKGQNSDRSVPAGACQREQIYLVIPALKIDRFSGMRFKTTETLSTAFYLLGVWVILFFC